MSEFVICHGCQQPVGRDRAIRARGELMALQMSRKGKRDEELMQNVPESQECDR